MLPTVCYIPEIHRSIGTTTVPVEHFFLPIAFGLGPLFLDEAKKYSVRRWPHGIAVKIAERRSNCIDVILGLEKSTSGT
jgi:hypothetical protein